MAKEVVTKHARFFRSIFMPSLGIALARVRVRQRLGDAGIRVVLTPERALNANAHAERFVRSVEEECIPVSD